MSDLGAALSSCESSSSLEDGAAPSSRRFYVGKSVACDTVRGICVRGRPIKDVSRSVLEQEVIRQRQQIEALQDSIRLNHTMWSKAMSSGAMSGNPADHQEVPDSEG